VPAALFNSPKLSLGAAKMQMIPGLFCASQTAKKEVR